MELGALQVIVVTMMTGVVLLVMFVVLGLLDNIVSRTSSKTEGSHINDVTHRRDENKHRRLIQSVNTL